MKAGEEQSSQLPGCPTSPIEDMSFVAVIFCEPKLSPSDNNVRVLVLKHIRMKWIAAPSPSTLRAFSPGNKR